MQNNNTNGKNGKVMKIRKSSESFRFESWLFMINFYETGGGGFYELIIQSEVLNFDNKLFREEIKYWEITKRTNVLFI